MPWYIGTPESGGYWLPDRNPERFGDRGDIGRDADPELAALGVPGSGPHQALYNRGYVFQRWLQFTQEGDK